jgi:hypothetical protein
MCGCFANFKTSRRDESASENDSDEWEDTCNDKHGRVRKRVRFADDDGELMEEDVINLVSDESSESYDQHDEEMLEMDYEDEVTEISNLNLMADELDVFNFKMTTTRTTMVQPSMRNCLDALGKFQSWHR